MNRVQWTRPDRRERESSGFRSDGGQNENTAGVFIVLEHLFGYSRSKTIQIQSIGDFFLREYYGSFNGYFTLLPPINFLSQLGIDKVHAGDPI